MASTRTTLLGRLDALLGDSANTIWTAAEKKNYLDSAITSLYPYWFQRNVDTTTATSGPIQTAPSGARNIFMIGHQRSGSTRVRPLRSWEEGTEEAFITKTGISGDTLVWFWTSGWPAPAEDSTELSVPVESEPALLVRAQISALEALLSDRVKSEKYHAIQVRQAGSEEDIGLALDALHATLREHYERAMPLPEKRG